MGVFNNSDSPEDIKTSIREHLKKQSTELEELKQEIAKLNKSQSKLKEKYEFVLETLLEKIGKEPDRFPTGHSKLIEAQQPVLQRPIVQLRDVQLLMLLEQSKATNKTFAVTANQLITAYGIEVSDRTLRNKLAALELRGLVISFGSRPKYFFITPTGVDLLHKQKRGVLSFEPV